MTGTPHCPLCGAAGAAPFHRDRRRAYLRCQRCWLVFVPSAYHLSPAREKAEYDLHRNDVDDPGYRRFLARLAEPLLQRLPPGAEGLEFGCGPGPALAQMLEAAGMRVRLYDPFYQPDPGWRERDYDFITATEVVEHLRRPGAELAQLWSRLRQGACLGVMTKLVLDAEAFARWHYKNDPTHISFFSRDTWRWWARQQKAQLDFVATDVVLLTRPGG